MQLNKVEFKMLKGSNAMKFTDPYFENICDIGDLFLDEIFFEFENIPVLFLCRDRDKNIYLCLCSEIRKVQNWMICKISRNILASMLKDKITIRQAFELLDDKLYIVQYTKDEKLCSKQVPFNEIAEEDLPDKDVYLEIG